MSQESLPWMPVQNYTKLRRECLANHTLFEDPYFPADYSSIWHSGSGTPYKPEWKRPSEIVSKPKLFTEGASRFDVSQGMMGNCWLVAAMSTLAMHEKLLSHVVHAGQSFDRGYAGIFHFQFWHFGEWIDIVVDDRLPTHNGKLMFVHSEDDNEFWSALLEKAYAKLYGSYESLKGGKPSEAMVDFTGGVVETIKLADCNADELFMKILRNKSRSSLMGCSIRAESRHSVEEKLDTGLVKGIAYSITGATKITVRGTMVKLIRIRTPWGQHEWNGDWSDNSQTWKMISSRIRQELEAASRDDGEFWMSFTDFLKNFTDFEMCSLSVDEFNDDKALTVINISGSWSVKDGTAGGCRNFPTFVNNPQYVVNLRADDGGDGKCFCHVALLQKQRRKRKIMGTQDLSIGFSIYKAPSSGNTVDKKYVDHNSSVANSGSISNVREVQKQLELDPGNYIIIPCCFNPDEEGDFLLRIFTEKSASSDTSAASGDDIDQALLDSITPTFECIAGANDEIDEFELQDMLTISFRADLSGILFSLDACKSMITMLDEDESGGLNIKEFAKLLSIIKTWKATYKDYDKNRSGFLDRNEFCSAIRKLGYQLSPRLFDKLFNNFSSITNKMAVDNFIACVTRVKLLKDSFEKVSQGGTLASLSLDEFLDLAVKI